MASIERVGGKAKHHLNVLLEKLTKKTDNLVDTMDSAQEIRVDLETRYLQDLALLHQTQDEHVRFYLTFIRLF